MRSATRSADMPGPGSRFGHDVTMRQRVVAARATCGAASAPAIPAALPMRPRREILLMTCSRSTNDENDAPVRGRDRSASRFDAAIAAVT